MPKYTYPYHVHICRYETKNICLRPFFAEVNSKNYLCPPIHKLMADFDSFIDRAEIFHLDEEKASRLWTQLQTKKEQDIKKLCTVYTPENNEHLLSSPLTCTHYHDTLCLRMLPQCQQPCNNFTSI